MGEAATVSWTEQGEPHLARWLSESGAPAPGTLLIADDRTTAHDAYGLAGQGTALLWRGDFHNARQLLTAMASRIERHARRSRRGAACAARRRRNLSPASPGSGAARAYPGSAADSTRSGLHDPAAACPGCPAGLPGGLWPRRRAGTDVIAGTARGHRRTPVAPEGDRGPRSGRQDLPALRGVCADPRGVRGTGRRRAAARSACRGCNRVRHRHRHRRAGGGARAAGT